MKRNHNTGPQETRNRAKKITTEKCLWLTDRHTSIRINADLLIEHCYMSRSNAYKIVSGKSKLQKPLEELLFYKLAGTTPLGPGYYMVEDGLSMPNGFVFNADQLDQYGFYMQIHRSIDRDMKALLSKIETLKHENKVLSQRIDWLNKKAKREEKAAPVELIPKIKG